LSGNIFVDTFSVALLSAFMCNLVNNIPMTAMMLSIIQQAGLSSTLNTAMGYSLVIVQTWAPILRHSGLLPGYSGLRVHEDNGWNTTITDLLKIGLFVTPIAILGASMILAIELSI